MDKTIKAIMDRRKILSVDVCVFLLTGILIAGCLGSVPSDKGKLPGNTTPLFITLDPAGQHSNGEPFTITGTTNLPEDHQIHVEIYEEILSRKPRMDDTFYGLTGNATTTPGPDGISHWAFVVNTTGLIPQKYSISISAGNHDPAIYTGDTFYLIPSEIAIKSNTFPVHIDPIAFHNPGETFLIGGNTTLAPAGGMNISISSGNFLPNGEFESKHTFTEGIAHVQSGTKGINRWNLELNTTGFASGEYLIEIRSDTGDRIGYGILVLHDLPLSTSMISPVFITPPPTPCGDPGSIFKSISGNF